MEEELVLKEGMRTKITQLHHDVLVAGYGEKWKTTELVMRNYWWLEVIKDVEKYIEGCNMCQRMKNRTEVLVEKLKLNKVPEKP